MGDPAHQSRVSDHNLGNAIDVTHSPGSGLSAAWLAEILRRQMSTTPTGRITYIIWNRRIASPTGGWRWRPYSGPNPHTTHVHVSIKASARGEVRPWKLA